MRTLRLKITSVGKWQSSNSKPYILSPKPIIFTNMQAPITTVPSND